MMIMRFSRFSRSDHHHRAFQLWIVEIMIMIIIGSRMKSVLALEGSDGSTNIKPCSLNRPDVYSSPPKISFLYDGRRFNSTFHTLRKSSARDNNIYLLCFATYPVQFRGGEEMVEKPSLKLFEDNLETYCETERRSQEATLRPECVYYMVKSFLPVHHLDENVISAKCESYCAQVVQGTSISVVERRKVIYGNVSTYKIQGRGEGAGGGGGGGSVSGGKKVKEEADATNGSSSVFMGPGVNHDLVQIYISPVGALGKYWNIKCTTYSRLTAKGAWLVFKLRGSDELFLANYTKEYRKAGIHTIRTTFDRPSGDIDYLLCLFPRLDDFPWISRFTSIHFEAPMTYWECVLHFCGAFVGLFIIVAGVCFCLHRWLHSDCWNHHHHNKNGTMPNSVRSSQQQLQFGHRQLASLQQQQSSSSQVLQWGSSLEAEEEEEEEEVGSRKLERQANVSFEEDEEQSDIEEDDEPSQQECIQEEGQGQGQDQDQNQVH